jgi:hypothetical protein
MCTVNILEMLEFEEGMSLLGAMGQKCDRVETNVSRHGQEERHLNHKKDVDAESDVGVCCEDSMVDGDALIGRQVVSWSHPPFLGMLCALCKVIEVQRSRL